MPITGITPDAVVRALELASWKLRTLGSWKLRSWRLSRRAEREVQEGALAFYLQETAVPILTAESAAFSPSMLTISLPLIS